MKPVKARWVAVAALAVISTVVSAKAETLKNIVLVHGAWVDASGWKAVYEHLIGKGFNVTMVQGARNLSLVMTLLQQSEFLTFKTAPHFS